MEPGFKFGEQIIRGTVQNAMGLDALESSHPISVAVDHPDEISEIFDAISYSKGTANFG